MKLTILFATLLSYICNSVNTYPRLCFNPQSRGNSFCDVKGTAPGKNNNKICNDYADTGRGDPSAAAIAGRCWSSLYKYRPSECPSTLNLCKCECTNKNPLRETIGSMPFQIIHESTGDCLTRSNDNIILQECSTTRKSQQWKYYPNNRAVTAIDEDFCMAVISGRNKNGQSVDVWENDDCVNWELSQWIFMANGLIRSSIASDKHLTVNKDGKGIKIEEKSNNNDQIFKFPDGAFRGSSISSECEGNRLEQLTQQSTNELAATGWNLGTGIAAAAAGKIPKVGSAVSASISIIRSIWNPTEVDVPEASELINDLRDEINDVVQNLKECLDSRIINKNLEYQASKNNDYVTIIMNHLLFIEGASGQDQIEDVGNLYDDFRGWIPIIFEDFNDYTEYQNLLPIYEMLLPLWSTVSQEMLIVQLNENDCGNYQNVLKHNREGFKTMKRWIENAIDSILNSGIGIGSGSSWRAEQRSIYKRKYVSPIEYFVEALDDISPHLASDGACTESTDDGGHFNFQPRKLPEDYIIKLYKYIRNNNGYDVTLSVSDSSEIIKARGYILADDSEIYQLYDKAMGDNTKPVYKKYNVENNAYLITVDPNQGSGSRQWYGNNEAVSTLGFCSTSDACSSSDTCSPDVLLCDDITLNKHIWGLNTLFWHKHIDSGTFKQLSIGIDGLILGLSDGNPSGFLYKFDNDLASSRIDPINPSTSKFKQISVADEHNIFSIGLTTNRVYKSENGGHNWKVFGDTEMEMISAGIDDKGTDNETPALWGLGNGDESGIPYQYNFEQNKWDKKTGRLSQISVASSKHIWGVQSGGKMVRWDDNKWIEINNNALDFRTELIANIKFSRVHISSDGAVWAIGNGNDIFRNICDKIYLDNGLSIEWVRVSGGFKQIESENGILIAVNGDNIIYDISDPYPKCHYLQS